MGRASGCGEQVEEAAARHRTGLGAVPCAFRSFKAAAAALLGFAKLQDLGNHRHAARASLSSRPPPPVLLPPPFSFPLLPFSHSPRRTFPGTSGFFFHDHGVRAVAGAGCGGLVWARSQSRALSLAATVAAAEGGCGRGRPAPAATELVGDLGSFLLLGSTFLSTARHCLHYFS